MARIRIMARHKLRFAVFLFVCFMCILTGILLTVLNDYITRDKGMRFGFKVVPRAMKHRKMLGKRKPWMIRDDGHENNPKRTDLDQQDRCNGDCNARSGNIKPFVHNHSDSCKEECGSKSPESTHGKLPTWSNRTLLSTANTTFGAFRPILSPLEYIRYMDLFAEFRRICKQHDLLYMLYGGTLLGAYRHLGLVPWDDDIDVIMNGSERGKIKTRFDRVPGYGLFTPRDQQWKFIKHNSSILMGSDANRKMLNEDYNSRMQGEEPSLSETFANNGSSTWPNIHIYFFGENSTHIWDDNPKYTFKYCFRKSDVFPLKHMQYEANLQPVPRHTRTILTTTYKINACVPLAYSHRFETPVGRRQQVPLPCRLLYNYVPFVFRACNNGNFVETLVMGNQSLYSMSTKC